MNPKETAEMTALIRRIRDEMNITILLIEHDMRVVMGISDRITVLDHGENDCRRAAGRDSQQSEGDRGLPGPRRGEWSLRGASDGTA